MNLSIKYSTLYFIVDLIIFLTVYLSSAKSLYLGSLLLLIYIFYFIIFKHVNFKDFKPYLVFIFEFFILIFLGIISLNSSNTHDILRDAIYFIYPLLCIIYGSLFFKKMSIQKIFNLIIFSGIFVSITPLLSFVRNPMLFQDSLREIRIDNGNGYIASIIALIILLLIYNPFKIKKVTNFFSIFVLLCALLLSFSRTSYIVGILGLFFFYFFSKNKIKNLNTIFILLIFSTFALSFVPKEIINDFTKKILNGANEVTGSQLWDWQSINENWRGYENFKAVQLFKNSSIFNKIFGFGLGSYLPIDLEILLSGKYYSAIPLLHNEYFTMLLKTGIVGLMLNIVIHIQLLYKSYKIKDHYAKWFAIFLTIVLSFEGVIVRGIFNPESGLFCLSLLGGLISIDHDERKNDVRIE